MWAAGAEMRKCSPRPGGKAEGTCTCHTQTCRSRVPSGVRSGAASASAGLPHTRVLGAARPARREPAAAECLPEEGVAMPASQGEAGTCVRTLPKPGGWRD